MGKGWSAAALLARGGAIVGEEVELIFTINGLRVKVRADLLALEDGKYVYIESKYSVKAGYTDNQQIVIPELVKAGDDGLIAEVGARSGTLTPGDKIQVVFQGDVWSAGPTLHGH